MRKLIATTALGLFLLSAATVAAKELGDFKFYVTDNGSGVGIDAATIVSAQDSTGREIQINFTVLVQDVANARVPGAKVTATDKNGKTKTLTADKNGRCQFKKFLQGRMKISVTAQGFADASVTPTVANNREVAITLRVPER